MTPRTEVITVLQKLMIYFMKLPESYTYPNIAEVYDGSIKMFAVSGESQDEVREKAVEWVYENYNVPMNLETSDLLYHQAKNYD